MEWAPAVAVIGTGAERGTVVNVGSSELRDPELLPKEGR